MDNYVLNGWDSHAPKKCTDNLTWELFMNGPVERRRVGRTVVGSKLVSTVFLGIDHSHGNGALQLFETMVFPMIDGEIAPGEADELIARYSDWDSAATGHQRVVEQLESIHDQIPN